MCEEGGGLREPPPSTEAPICSYPRGRSLPAELSTPLDLAVFPLGGAAASGIRQGHERKYPVHRAALVAVKVLSISLVAVLPLIGSRRSTSALMLTRTV